jgi:O-antigen ligase
MMSDFFPVGSGFGSFDPVYRSYERVETLSTTYVNHAHNDVVQLIIEGGLPATALILTFAGWFVVRAVHLWRQRLVSNQQLLGRVASAALLMIMLSSLVDYPLRTPMFATVAAILCCWMLPERLESRFTMRD